MGWHRRKRRKSNASATSGKIYHVSREFESVAAFAVYADRVGVDRASDRGEWSGGSFADAVRRATAGWPDGYAIVQRVAERIRDHIAPAIQQTALVRSISGNAGIDIGAYCAGRPDCLLDYAARPARKPIRIHISVNAAGTADSHAITNRGAAALAAADCLTEAGYAVEIVASIVNSYDGGHTSAFLCRVKSHGEPVDIDAAAFALANPGFARQLGFRAKEGEPEIGGHFAADGMGRAWNDYSDPEATIYLPRMINDSQWQTEESSAMAILEELARANIGGVTMEH